MIDDIVKLFDLPGTVVRTGSFGNGHINSTYKIEMSDRQVYTLQKINTYVFRDPVGLMRNIELLMAHISKKIDDPRGYLHLIPAKDGKTYAITPENEYWRVYDFVSNSLCVDTPMDNEMFEEAASAFGMFQQMLTDFPVDQLIETIPNFHNTVVRYETFEKALAEDKMGRADSVKKEIEFAHQEKPISTLYLDALANHSIPLRVTHNDTKINNVLFDVDTKKALCVIDLDTVMPGVAATDFGDGIRFGANTALEDEQNLDMVYLNIDLFEAFAHGFLRTCRGYLTEPEIDLFAPAAKLITLETGLRFLTDYLMGDVYFQISYPRQNLDRCRTQFKLVADMNEKMDRMKAIIRNI